MGLLSKVLATGAKGAQASNIARSVSKSKMNPLLKRRGEELRKKIEEENVGLGEDTTVGKMYSPLLSTVEQMDIGAAGTKAENIEAFIRKRAPNVTESEKQFYGLEFLSDEPQRKFTRKQVLETLKDVNTEYTIHKRSTYGDGDTTQQFGTMQRQPIAAAKIKYEELMVNADKRSIPLGEEVNHFNPETVVHTRLSVVRPYAEQCDKMGVDTYEAVLVEEIQSDLHRIANMSDRKIRQLIEGPQHLPFSGTIDETNPFVDVPDTDRINLSALKWHEFNIEDSASDFDLKIGNKKALHSIIQTYDRLEKLESATRIQGALDNGRRQIKDELRLKLKDEGIIVDARDPYDLIKKAYKYVMELNEDYIDQDWIDEYDSYAGAGDGAAYYFEKEIDQFTRQIMEEYNGHVMNNIKRNRGEKAYKADPRKPAPVQSNTEIMRKGLFANIAYAKENGINKVLVPSAKEIAQQRVGTFEEMAHTIKNQEIAEKYFELQGKGNDVAADELALDYFTNLFEPLYENALGKVLRSLMQETKGAVKVKKVDMPYRDALANTTEMKTLTEIDISNFEFDPKNDALRFNRGGLVA